MKQYHDLLERILNEGVYKGDRTGTGTYSVFGHTMRFDLSKGFPLITTKKIHFKGVLHELLWFIKGDTNVEYLQDNGVRIWNEWANDLGDLGPVYGAMLRSWPTTNGTRIDQLAKIIREIKTNPDSRRLVVSFWNPEFLPKNHLSPQQNVGLGLQALAPCHFTFTFNVTDGKLNCHLTMRSNDIMLGCPWNLASYSLLTMMIAQICNLVPGELLYCITDAHLYSNHIEQAQKQLSRSPYPLPTVKINPEIKDIDSFAADDFELVGYQSHPHIPAPIAV